MGTGASGRGSAPVAAIVPAIEAPELRATALGGYGTVILEFVATSIRNVSVTLCDSAAITNWATEPELAPSDLRAPIWTSARRSIGTRTLSIDEVLDTPYLNVHRNEYAEIQIHQVIGVEHIKRANLTTEPKQVLLDAVAGRSALPFELLGPDRQVLSPVTS